MATAPKSLIKSRSTLQTLTKNPQSVLMKYSFFDRVLQDIWNDISKPNNHIKPNPTHYIINFSQYPRLGGYSNFFNNGNLDEGMRIELIELLKKEYTDCDIKYIITTSGEIPGYNSGYKSGVIIIDWS